MGKRLAGKTSSGFQVIHNLTPQNWKSQEERHRIAWNNQKNGLTASQGEEKVDRLIEIFVMMQSICKPYDFLSK